MSGNITGIASKPSIDGLIASVNVSNRTVTSRTRDAWPGLDDLDFRLIAVLQRDGRASYARMAQQLGSAVATVRQRYERLVRDGYVHTVALVDPARLGRAVVCHLEVSTVGDVDAVVDQMTEIPEIAWLGVGLDYCTIFTQLSTTNHAALVTLINERIRPIPGVGNIISSIQLRSWSPTFRYAGSSATPDPDDEDSQPWAGDPAGLGIDDIDRGLLECLERDARMTVTAMTERVGLSVPAARQRLVKLLANRTARIRVRPHPQSDKIIPVRLNIAIDADSSDIARKLADLPHVTYIMESTGPAGLRMEVLGRDEDCIRSSLASVWAIEGVTGVGLVRYARVVLHTGHW